ncbi:MAG TPA: type I polyketide synthase [Thermoanaerobaculia bacterium]|jgi:enediyne polyketide synthase|nr:type I polyketide synthase [Thermoanaerobaculia bacterium]
MRQGIAVVGMACRYAGARSPAELWENVLAGRREFRRIPPERLRIEDYLTADATDPDGLYAAEAAVLEGWEFDRVRFRVAGSTFRSTDLAHWLALEVADQALADAGFPAAEGLPRDATGVLLGNSLTGEFSRANLLRLRWPYVRRVLAAALGGLFGEGGWDGERTGAFLARLETEYKAPFPPPTEESLAGGLSNTIAGRICNHFDLHGGGYTLDGACASSLLAVANACTGLAAGDLDAALAGGVDLSLDPFELVGFARTGALAPDEMRIYDARSAGFIPGEGCGFVVLMREEDALRQGCRIYAVIRGWGISSDGHGGISRPEPAGQKIALARAYRRAGFGIETVGYFEGHGTGTAVGDAAELQALAEAVRASGSETGPVSDPPASVGSIKANIGHTKAAAGVAGLIKAALAVHHRVLPPTTGCEEPHPALRGAPLRVLARGEAWPAGRALRAGVSAMGFGGINAHVVLEGTVLEGETGAPRQALAPRERMLLSSAQDAELFLFAAPDRSTLTAEVERLAALAPRLSRSELADLAAALHERLGTGPARAARAAITAGTARELAARCERLLDWLETAGETAGRARIEPRHGVFLAAAAPDGRPPRLGFLFPGQGSPVHLPASGLPGGALARRFESLGALYATAELPAGADPLDTAAAQPAIVAHSLAGLAILERLGLRGVVAVGHSLGEITALAWAGAMDGETALRLAAVRGRAMAETDGEGLGNQSGAMASLGASARIVEEVIAGVPGVVIAAYNAPERTVVSGDAAAVETVLARATARGLATTRLRVSHAFHSPCVAAAAPRLAEALEALPLGGCLESRRGALTPDPSPILPPNPRERGATAHSVDRGLPARSPLSRGLGGRMGEGGQGGEGPTVASTVTGELLDAVSGSDLRQILIRQVTEPVRFTAALHAVRDHVDLWIEVGPGHALTDLAAETLPDRPILALDSGGPSLAGLLAVAGAAFVLGAPLDTAGLFSGRFTRPFDLDRPLRFLANPCESAPIFSPANPPPTREVASPSPTLKPVVADGLSALDVVRRLVAERAELPAIAVRGDSRLLSDLHLSSISVGQLVGEAARRLGLRPPASPTDFAQATVAQVAAALEDQARLAPAGESAEPAAAPPGVDTWVRPFTVELVRRDLPRHPAEAAAAMAGWTVVAPPDHPFCADRAGLEAELAALPGDGVLVCLPEHDVVGDGGEEHAALLLRAARAVLAAPRPGCFAVVQHGGGGGGFARTLHLELPQWTVRIVDLPFALPDAAARVLAEIRASRGGYGEAVYDASGVRRVPVLRLLPPDLPDDPLSLPLGPQDVLLVTGGGKGIAAECALDLARVTGARLALLGRSAPENDAELAANLDRMRAAGADPLYLAADVTDGAAVRAAVERIAAVRGPVTAVLHGAGTNTPCLLGALDETAFWRTLAPKVRGLDNVLQAVDADRLRLLVTFGSIIACTGLRGEADYAAANELMALRAARFGRAHPACRCLTLQWSVWSGVGMGERLGTLESLIRQGISPIPPDAGLAALRALLARRLDVSSVVVTGRFGEPPTLEIERPEVPLLRFLEKPRVFYPGVELVVDTEISADTDPYLADHVFRGEPLFAAVLGLEAMAQAARLVTGIGELPVFENVELRRPVAVAPGRSTTVRVAALVRDTRDTRDPGRPATVELTLRDSSTGFQSDHFRAVCRYGTPPPSQRLDFPLSHSLALDPARDLYGGILFHGGRFRRLHAYRRLCATECLAEISPDGLSPWFGRWLPAELLLGDPGARDAAIHGIQACIPHATVLPVGVDRVISGRLAHDAPLVFAARERCRHGDELVYDLEIRAADGTPRERWEGLRLRIVDRPHLPEVWNAALLGPYVERRLDEILPGSGVRVALERGGDSAPVLSRLLQGTGAAAPRHRPDGRREIESRHGHQKSRRQVSVSHAGGLVLAVTREGTVSCDLEAVAERSAETWRGLLGEERFRLAERLVLERGETPSAAATRVWTAAESLAKAGAPHGAPLLLEELLEGGNADGWVLLRSGRLRVGTLLTPVLELDGPAALAILVDAPGESRLENDAARL